MLRRQEAIRRKLGSSRVSPYFRLEHRCLATVKQVVTPHRKRNSFPTVILAFVIIDLSLVRIVDRMDQTRDNYSIILSSHFEMWNQFLI